MKGPILSGGKYLEYRGYDSLGVAVSCDGRIVSAKAVGLTPIADVHPPAGRVALGQTHRATRGGAIRPGAYLHTNCSNRLALIRNGIVEQFSRPVGQLTLNSAISIAKMDTQVRKLGDAAYSSDCRRACPGSFS